MSLAKKVKRWWHGELQQPVSDGNFFFLSTKPRRHWTSRIIHSLLEFLKAEWRVVAQLALGAAAVGVAIFALK